MLLAQAYLQAGGIWSQIIVVAYIVMAYIVAAYKVMACVVPSISMAYMVMPSASGSSCASSLFGEGRAERERAAV